MRLPTSSEFAWWVLSPPDMTTAAAPRKPRTSPATLPREKRSMPEATDMMSTSSGTMVSIIDPSIGRGKHVFYILAVDLLTLLPEGWYPREQCRGHERCRDHCQRFDVVSEDDVVEGVVARPDDVAEQQRQMGAVIESFGLFHCLHFPASRAKDLPKCAEKAWEHDGVA